ncbi:DUF4145 domain-containing protein [Spirosoma agri]|uniref:DUF4145 domain-containing protein n=1 Tax=Spirosoma agri TaxID=1987381 RepID=A0A6M0IJ76_9BACT|nr:DUF4145 domain-containing protein [Spirosoma agri]NEU68264.1 DUF4145 domain-containing protein [Spirosoma agri]
MLTLDDHLKLGKCPHCSVDKPNLVFVSGEFYTQTDNGKDTRYWRTYKCSRCGGVVTASAKIDGYNRKVVQETYPGVDTLSDILPPKVRNFLQQAIETTFAPSGSIMLCASAVDAMLKEKGYSKGSLYKRIDEAAKNGLLTPDMETWAHQVRLDANDERHADENASMPSVEDAKKAVEFTRTLAEFLFVLPAKVTRGIAATNNSESTKLSDPAPSTIISVPNIPN